MKIMGIISRVYYFSPHEGTLSKIILEIRIAGSEMVQVERIDTEESLAKQFGFTIREPHHWDTSRIENRPCEIDTEAGEDKLLIRYL
jgi:hypothetical protein